MEKIIVYTDGGSRNNPGPSGAGVYVVDETGKMLKETSQYLGVQTNNWAEYEAVFLGLSLIKKILGKKTKNTSVEVRLDSQLVSEQLSGRYQIKEATLFPQYIKVHNMRVKDFPNLFFTHIPREKNKEADRLANEAMDRG